uniref:Uncharacterized protein n=1 Tax=viral metagenome TaxID=1070528 RepID=A0A6C0AK93_9ZZZZ
MDQPSALIRRMQIQRVQDARENQIRAFGEFSRKFKARHNGLRVRSEETRRNFVSLLNENDRLLKKGKGRTLRRKNGFRRRRYSTYRAQ